MTTHTPGPWGAISDGKIITMTGTRVVVASTTGGFGHEVQEANARIIAAAPETAAERDKLKVINAELLAALKMARDCITYCRRTHLDTQAGEGIPVELLIDAAIAKAESA